MKRSVAWLICIVLEGVQLSTCTRSTCASESEPTTILSPARPLKWWSHFNSKSVAYCSQPPTGIRALIDRKCLVDKDPLDCHEPEQVDVQCQCRTPDQQPRDKLILGRRISSIDVFENVPADGFQQSRRAVGGLLVFLLVHVPAEQHGLLGLYHRAGVSPRIRRWIMSDFYFLPSSPVVVVLWHWRIICLAIIARMCLSGVDLTHGTLDPLVRFTTYSGSVLSVTVCRVDFVAFCFCGRVSRSFVLRVKQFVAMLFN